MLSALLGSALQAAETRGLSLNLRASEAADTKIVEKVELCTKSYELVIGNDNYTSGRPATFPAFFTSFVRRGHARQRL